MSVKSDLFKEIDAAVKRKKELAKEVSREKTIADWVAEFFVEVEKAKAIDTAGVFQAIAHQALRYRLQKLDRKVFVSYRSDLAEPQIEIRWSQAYIQAQQCEPVCVYDASSAFFQSAIERS